MRKPARTLFVFGAAAALLTFGAGTAHAATLYIDDIQHGTRKPIAISECRADGATCRISEGKQVSHSISGKTGVSFKVLNAELGGSYEETYTVTNSCESPKLNRGDVWVMFPRGDFVFFNVDHKEKGTAFLPTGVVCEVRSDWE